ncbi:hypothetical protein PG990_004055 [Apiospora arundinis]
MAYANLPIFLSVTHKNPEDRRPRNTSTSELESSTDARSFSKHSWATTWCYFPVRRRHAHAV